MSVIAWDGRVLAADKRACIGSLIRTTTKVFKLSGALAAYAGDADSGEALLAWFKNGAVPADFPSSQHGDMWAGLMVVYPNGDIHKYERTPYPIKFPPQIFAIGSGRDFALAAMHLGEDAVRAVGVACVFDSGCGNGVDHISFEGVHP